jgi:hypothetical protein
MSTDLKDARTGLLMVLSLLLGMYIGYLLTDITWNNWCVEKGWAEYNIKTGEVIYRPPAPLAPTGVIFNMDQHK